MSGFIDLRFGNKNKRYVQGRLFSNYPLLFFLMNTKKDNLQNLINSSYKTKKVKNKILIKTSIKEMLLNSENNNNNNNIFSNDNLQIITKGISYWKELNINSISYSKKLKEKLSQIKFLEIPNEEKLKEKVISIIKNLNKNMKIEGTSTFSLLYIDKLNMRMLCISIGDSLYSIMRFDNESHKYRMEFISKEKYHSFNTPYQIGKYGDSPENLISLKHEILENDIIILGNDCFWDNISIENILDIINNEINFNIDFHSIICEKLIEEAKKNSEDEFFISPFSIKAKENGFYYLGGKPGDILLNVSIIKYNNINNIKNKFVSESEFDQFSIASKFTSNTSIMNDIFN